MCKEARLPRVSRKFFYPSICCAYAPQPPPLKNLWFSRGGKKSKIALAINHAASRVALRSGTQFADTSAFAERCSGARYYCCHCAPQENRTQSHRRTLGFPPLTRSICFRSHSQKRFAVQRFFAKRRNERFQRAVRLCRTAAQSAPFRRRQFERKSVNTLSISPQAGLPCAAGPNLPIPRLSRKGECAGAIIESPHSPCTEENEPQSRRGGVFLQFTEFIRAFARRNS